MYKPKYHKKHLRKRSVVLLSSLVLLVGLAVGATIAYIFTNSDSLTNTFTPAEVKCEVKEGYNYAVKENVQIKNTGNVDAYIRAMVFVNWMDVSTNKIVPTPEDGQITYEYDRTKWVRHTDGYYYYTEKVPKDGFTTNLINKIERPTLAQDVVDAANGNAFVSKYKLNVEIIAEAIQAEPNEVVTTYWHVDPTKLIPTGSD